MNQFELIRNELQKSNTPRCPAQWRCKEHYCGRHGYKTEAEREADIAAHYNVWDEVLGWLDEIEASSGDLRKMLRVAVSLVKAGMNLNEQWLKETYEALEKAGD